MELSIEQKAQRYDETIEKLRDFYRDYDTVSCLIDVKEELANLIPELKESEDERIKKWIRKELESKYVVDNIVNNEMADKALAWLEKQGEPKSYWKPSKDEMDALYGLAYITNTMDDKKDEAVTKLYQDLKREFFNGASYENMFPSSPVDAPIKDEKQGEQNLANSAKTCKDEQNTADKVGQKFKAGDIITPKDGGHEPWQITQVDMLDKKYRFKDGYVVHFSQEDDYELVGHNHAWSEEDEKILDGVISNYESGYLPSVEKRDEIIKKLKSLKDRLQHQNYIYYNPYKEVVESITEMCKHYDKASHNGLRDFYDNVKVKCKDAKEYDSLYPQNTWKPSDEQMGVIESVMNYMSFQRRRLDSLYEQLKKLRKK